MSFIKIYQINIKSKIISYFIIALLLCCTILVFSFLFVQAAGTDIGKNLTPTQKIDNARNLIFSQRIEDYDISSLFAYEQSGQASWYGGRFQNRKTASGERYNMYDLTAAHKKLPFGTLLRVKNIESGKVTFVRINDRGPYCGKRIIDLSFAAASDIDGVGIPQVKIEGLINNDSLPLLNNDIYFFGYSFDLPLVCLPSNTLNFIDEAFDLQTAIEKYETALSDNPGMAVFLLVPMGNESYIPSIESEKYYIGYFQPNINDFKSSLVDNK